MATTTWRGALELTTGPFPIAIGVKLYARTKTGGKRGTGLKLVSPDGLPVKQRYIAEDGWSGTVGECSRGLEGPDGALHTVTKDALDAMGKAERTKVATPQSFAPMASIRWENATGSYAVLPDEKVAGSDRSIQALWNGLLDSGLAYMTTVTLRAGSPDRILAVYADDDGLWAVTLPRVEDQSLPTFQWERNEQIGQAFAEQVIPNYEVRDFDGAEFPNEAHDRRERVIEAILSGEPVQVPEEAPQEETPDLMALLGKAEAKATATTTTKEQVKA